VSVYVLNDSVWVVSLKLCHNACSELRSTTLSEAWLEKDGSDRESVSPRAAKHTKGKRDKLAKPTKHGGKPKGKDLWAKVRVVVPGVCCCHGPCDGNVVVLPSCRNTATKLRQATNVRENAERTPNYRIRAALK
jgi:hypothetical protein